MKVPELQNFLKARDIQVASDGRKRKRAELLELCKNAAKMKVSKVDEEIELKDDFIKSKTTLPGGKLLSHPHSLQFGPITSLTFQTSGFLIFIIIWLVKMAMTRLVYGRIKAFRVFAYTWTVKWRI